ncbi:MAG: carboxypeptidase-like regulatory domain-containing protein [Rubinisphaera brasiliensis]|uniref:carboxypeptidase-like regulatory domain-containing protein n=1 Tax=Rubinisphaera TaxID=1649490 RepID=UPI001F380D51|nr:carboxypeptidase-like regulatory domain-containing protein [Rubinisphaera sp. JC750]MBR9802873.1 carboxypeptidase regulatory-like domain-containing protein [bacterium]
MLNLLSATRSGCCLAACLLALSCVTGCGGGDGPELATVSGTVTLNGQPLHGAVVTFLPKSGGRPAMANTDEDGHFKLNYSSTEMGGVVGSNTVRVSKQEAKPDGSGQQELIPEKYNEQSSLEYEVKPGRNDFEISLESK